MSKRWARDEVCGTEDLASARWCLAPLSVVGLGHTGVVTAGCLASLGHRVVVSDPKVERVAAIMNRQTPGREAELGALIAVAVDDGFIEARADVPAAVAATNITIVALGEKESVRIVAIQLARGLVENTSRTNPVIVLTGPKADLQRPTVTQTIESVTGLKAGVDFGIASHEAPLRRGAAVADFFAPERTRIHVSDKRTARIVVDLFSPVDPFPFVSVGDREDIERLPLGVIADRAVRSALADNV